MKILVTGHKGFIGQNLMNALPKGWSAYTYDPLEEKLTRPKHLKIFQQIHDIDVVIHLGAISSTTERNVEKLMDYNLAWSIELAEICRERGILLQFASSASVYGKGNYIPMKEDHDCDPLNMYATSKYLFEQYLKLPMNKDLRWQAFRYFNVYGPHEKHKDQQASPFYQFAKQARETGVIKIFEGSDKYYRDFIHVDNVVETHIKMLQKNDRGIFNVGTGNPRSFFEVARDIACVYDAKIETILFPENLKDRYQIYTCANTTKLSMALHS